MIKTSIFFQLCLKKISIRFYKYTVKPLNTGRFQSLKFFLHFGEVYIWIEK